MERQRFSPARVTRRSFLGSALALPSAPSSPVAPRRQAYNCSPSVVGTPFPRLSNPRLNNQGVEIELEFISKDRRRNCRDPSGAGPVVVF